MARIFISYRRADSDGWAGRLRDALRFRFGDVVFQDVDNIADGEIFSDVIDRALQECDVALVIIGPNWASALDEEGRRRLDHQNDWVRTETAMVLNRNIRVIPVLVGGARLPRAEELPEDLRSLTRRQAREIRSSSWDTDVGLLANHLRQFVERPPSRKTWRYAAPAAVLLIGVVAFGASRFLREDAPAERIIPPVATAEVQQKAEPLATALLESAAREHKPEPAVAPVPASAKPSAPAVTSTEQPVAPARAPAPAAAKSTPPPQAAKPVAAPPPQSVKPGAAAKTVASAPQAEAAPSKSTPAPAPTRPAAPAAQPPPVAPAPIAIRPQSPPASAVRPAEPPARPEAAQPLVASVELPAAAPRPAQEPARPVEKPAVTASVAPKPPAASATLKLPNRPASARELTIGDSWTYRLRDARANRTLATVTHVLAGGDANGIRETVRAGDRQLLADAAGGASTSGAGAMQRRLPLQPRIFELHLDGTATLFEFAPFMAAYAEAAPGTTWARIPGAGNTDSLGDWGFSGRVSRTERVSVAAGTFEALKVELEGKREVAVPTTIDVFNETFASYQSYAIWFAPEIGRAVKYERRTFNRARRLLEHEQYELVSYQLK